MPEHGGPTFLPEYGWNSVGPKDEQEEEQEEMPGSPPISQDPPSLSTEEEEELENSEDTQTPSNEQVLRKSSGRTD